jgi:hypothetical protein
MRLSGSTYISIQTVLGHFRNQTLPQFPTTDLGYEVTSMPLSFPVMMYSQTAAQAFCARGAYIEDWNKQKRHSTDKLALIYTNRKNVF